MNKWTLFALCFLFEALLPAASQAQQRTLIDNYNDTIKGATTIGPLGSDLFGEQISVFDGTTEFHATDVNVPTNSGLPMMVGRKLMVNGRSIDERNGAGGAPGIFGSSWELDTPYLRGTFDQRVGWVADDFRNGSLQRCSSSSAAPPSVNGTALTSYVSYFAADYWNGDQINIPGQPEEDLLHLPSTGPRPNDGLSYVWSTKSNLRGSCLPTIQNGSGEGFLVRTLDGITYRFDWMVSKTTSSIYDFYCDNLYCYTTLAIPRVNVYLYATRVQDRFGNWIAYGYDPAAPDHLLSITSNEGSRIDLTYNAQGRVSTVTSGTRTWSYAYLNDLSSVVRPDGSQWAYTYSNLSNVTLTNSQALWQYCLYPNIGSMTSAQPPGLGETASVSMTSPSGAVGTFQFRRLIHGTNRTPGTCTYIYGFHPDPTPFGTKINGPPEAYQATSLYSKSISGPGFATLNWSYYYEPSWSWGSSQSCNDARGCGVSSRTSVTDPAGIITRYTFGNEYMTTAGELLSTTVQDASGIRRSTATSYLSNATGQPFPDSNGLPNANWSNPFANLNRPVTSNVVTQDGVTFNSIINGFDSFVRPVSVTKSSSLGSTRTDATAYFDDLSRWVLGQVNTSTCSAPTSCAGTVMSQTDFDATTALPWRTYSFGLLRNTLTYNVDGTLASVKDGNNNITTLSNWKRAIPQTITYPATVEAPSGTTKSAVVNDSGWLTSTTDEMAYTTNYSYDLMGRVSNISYPTNDTTAWSPTTLGFAAVNVAEYGLPPGHWTYIAQTGTGRKTTYYDAMWRPAVELSEDTNNVATRRFVVKRYDVLGRESFSSYPVSNLTSVNDSLQGTRTTYDALGRPTQSVLDSELGALTTSYAYLPGFQTQVTNPRGYSTTTSYQVFDSPETSSPISIASPGNASTTITRDVFGKPLSLTRTDTALGIGTTRSYVYDANQRLCKRIEPESGATLVDYDAAGNLAWKADGTSLNSLTCDRASVATGQKNTRTYNAMNRVTALTTPDGSADQTIAYTPDGLVSTGTIKGWAGGNTITTYAYNKRRLLVDETSGQLNWYTWHLQYAYDTNGSLASQTYPTGLFVDYAPNALGQPTKAGTFASNVSYYPNGGMRSFTYGNSIIHTLTQNARSLPQRSLDRKTGSAAVVDDTYSYDANANVAAITDGTSGNGGNRSMLYDGLDRLTSTNAPHLWWINATTSYDALDNIRSNLVGNRTYNYTYDPTSKRLAQLVRPDSSVAYSLSYDTRGNLSGKGAGQDSYDFDITNRLTDVYLKEYYRYDFVGRRVMSWRPYTELMDLSMYSQSGQFVYDTDSRTKNQANEYVYLNGSLVAKHSQDLTTHLYSTTYEHTDALHSPVAETDSSGNYTRIELYTPYGEPSDRIYVQGPGFTGHVTDVATGLTYAQQRYYDPVIGRFLSVDPVAASDSGVNFNRYWYGNNNPYRFTDSDGRQATTNQDGTPFQLAAEYSPNGVPRTGGTARELLAAGAETEEGIFTLVNPVGDARYAGEAVESGFLGGAYRDVRGVFGNQAHHMPADSVSFLSKREGPALSMTNADHAMTASFGNSKAAKAYRDVQGRLIAKGKFGDAVRMDIRDIRSKFGNKYNLGIKAVVELTKKLGLWK